MAHAFTRRGVMVVGAALALGFAATSAAAGPANIKAEVEFQNTPKAADGCAECASFIPGETRGGPGTCKAAQGPIPQNGWRVLFARRKA